MKKHEIQMNQRRGWLQSLRDRVQGAISRWFHGDRSKEEAGPAFRHGRPLAIRSGGFPLFSDVHLLDESDAIRVKVPLPGLSQNEVSVQADGRRLYIQGERRVDEHHQRRGYTERRSSYGVYKRTLPLPCGVDPAGGEARYEDGVLEVRLPKAEENRAAVSRVRVH